MKLSSMLLSLLVLSLGSTQGLGQCRPQISLLDIKPEQNYEKDFSVRSQDASGGKVCAEIVLKNRDHHVDLVVILKIVGKFNADNYANGRPMKLWFGEKSKNSALPPGNSVPKPCFSGATSLRRHIITGSCFITLRSASTKKIRIITEAEPNQDGEMPADVIYNLNLIAIRSDKKKIVDWISRNKLQ